MERDLRELTLDRMLEIGNVEFYERDVDYDRIREGFLDTSIDMELDFDLSKEQELSDMIYDLTIAILKVSDRLVKPLKSIQYFNDEEVTIYFTDGSYTCLNNKIVLKGAYKFFKEIGYNKKYVSINTFKNSTYWEVNLGIDFDYRDKRICCSEFLLEAVIQVIEDNLLDDDDGAIYWVES